MIQMHAFYLFLAVGGLLVLIFIYVAASTRHSQEMDYHAAYGVRKKVFFIVLAILLAGLGLTLGKMPYPRENQIPDKVVFVVGKQFSFGISETPITNDQEYEATTYAAPVQLPLGSLVEFRVTSFDVNHGFGVYSSDGHLLGQTQAMPGYVNRLRLRFSQPGRYTVLCLELCGMDHHRMRGVFDVK
jgi:cytochrome c oxidase subunit II